MMMRHGGARQCVVACVALASSIAVAMGPALAAEPRLAPVAESEWTEAQRAVVARFAPAGRATNVLRTYLHHPVLAENLLPFERYISSESTLEPRHRQLLILRTAWLCRSGYVWAQHASVSRAAGMTGEDLERIARGPDASGWSPFEAALLRAVDELIVDAFVSDATWSALTARYDTKQVMDAVFTVAEFTMVAGTVNSLGVAIDEALPDRLPNLPVVPAATRTNARLIGKQARITPLEPSEWPPDVKQWLARYGNRPVAAIYRTYARHVAMDQPRTSVSEHIRQDSTLSTRIRELLIIRIGVLCRSEYEWAAHAPAGRRAGMTDADIHRIVEGPAAAGGDPVENALLRAADELHRDNVVSDSTWRELSAVFDAKQMLDVLTTVGGYRMVSMALNTFGVQLEPGAERFPAALR